jgi:hypothetical protein
LDYYIKCTTRTRNNVLYIFDRALLDNIQPASADTNTRQNDNGGASVFECTEEHDYYPYWHPYPWRDIAIFTSNPDNCTYYQQFQNIAIKGECWNLAGTIYLNTTTIKTVALTMVNELYNLARVLILHNAWTSASLKHVIIIWVLQFLDKWPHTTGPFPATLSMILAFYVFVTTSLLWILPGLLIPHSTVSRL